MILLISWKRPFYNKLKNITSNKNELHELSGKVQNYQYQQRD